MSSTSVINIKITSDTSEYPCEKHFPSTMLLHDLKTKLQLVVGMSADAMQMELRDKNGAFLSSLSDDNATLEHLGITEGMQIHVKDSSGQLAKLLDASSVEKYTISDEQYEKRGESVRAWKKREGIDKQHSEQAQLELNLSKKLSEGIKVGDRCSVKLSNQPEKRGVVSYVGETHFKPGHWIGITYDEPLGKNDGSVGGKRYFTCTDKYGAFVKPQDVQIGDFPPFVTDEEMEEI